MVCTCILANKCCCKWRLRTGVLVISVITLVIAAVWVAVNVWNIKKTLDTEDNAAKYVILPCIIVAIVGLWGISAVLMPMAICLGKRRLLIPWMIMTILAGVIEVIGLIVEITHIVNTHAKAAADAIILSAIEVFVMLFFMYCFVIVVSYYQYNLREPVAWDEEISRKRKPVYTGTEKPASEDPQQEKPLNPETVVHVDGVRTTV